MLGELFMSLVCRKSVLSCHVCSLDPNRGSNTRAGESNPDTRIRSECTIRRHHRITSIRRGCMTTVACNPPHLSACFPLTGGLAGWAQGMGVLTPFLAHPPESTPGESNPRSQDHRVPCLLSITQAQTYRVRATLPRHEVGKGRPVRTDPAEVTVTVRFRFGCVVSLHTPTEYP